MRGPIEDGAGRRGKILTPSRSKGGAILRKPAPPRPVTKTTERGASSRIPTMNPIRIPPDTSLTHLLLMSLILRYLTTLHLRYPADRSIIHAPEKELERSMDLSMKTAISARIRGHRSVVRQVSNWHLGLFRVKYPNHKSMNTS